jgi:3-oxoacyl-[acyl-carrier-protein] synthase II
MARDIELAVAAARLGVEHAGMITRANRDDDVVSGTPNVTYPPHRMGCQIGAGLISAEAEEMAAAMATARDDGASGGFSMGRWGGEGGAGMEALTPLWMLKYLPNMLACHVTIIHGAEGPSNTITCAEASGLLSLGESARVIERGAADVCFSGGAESKINPMGMLRIGLAGRLAHAPADADPAALVQPYSGTKIGGARPSVGGGVIGEGGGILVLENAETAAARSARPLAEIVGFGAGQSSQYYDQPEDPGYEYAIRNALDDARLNPTDIQAIVPLASGMHALDRAEAAALDAVFGGRLPSIPLVTLSPNIGNCFAGAGGLQAAVGAWCLHSQSLPARLHAGADHTVRTQRHAPLLAGRTPPGAHRAELDNLLVCTPSLGGQNAALILKRVSGQYLGRAA